MEPSCRLSALLTVRTPSEGRQNNWIFILPALTLSENHTHVWKHLDFPCELGGYNITLRASCDSGISWFFKQKEEIQWIKLALVLTRVLSWVFLHSDNESTSGSEQMALPVQRGHGTPTSSKLPRSSGWEFLLQHSPSLIFKIYSQN